ncbi:FUSC family protein [Streptomyces sp. NPDC001404]|uniref:FUSC family protein n=1 Tax=Streptomyces sp. NPDC001404 TaxID=3364571 RepID=UPI00367C8571
MAKPPRVRPLPLRGLLRLNRPADTWPKPAFSAALAMAVPDLVLLALGRLDLALYTAAGALCALYGHDRPYAARARTVAWVVLGAVAGTGAALTCASLVPSTAVLVLLAALVAAVHKVLCDATRIGPPGNIVLTFVTSTMFFVPQRIGDVPAHLGLVLAAGAFAWLVCMAPAPIRPHGPERIAVARALEAADRLLRAEPSGLARARHATAAASGAARRALAGAPAHVAGPLHHLVLQAEAALAGHGGDAGQPADRARALRRGEPLPESATPPPPLDAPSGTLADRLRPGSPLLPAGARVAVGGTLAGWASLAVGSTHPYWAVVTAASVFQANTTLSWQRAVQRVVGNLLGLALFTALLPLTRSGAVAMVLTALALQVGAEAFISRNYWLGTLCVTPMALLLNEFAGNKPAAQLIGDRWTDTLVGAAVGLLTCVLVTNRRAADRTEAALARAREARHAAAAAPADPGPHRDRLAAALVELREAADVAAGEWWQRALPDERVAEEEREGHRTLAALAGRLPARATAA